MPPIGDPLPVERGHTEEDLMRTFGMWLLAGLFVLAGWDAFERVERRDSRSDAPVVQETEAEARATEDGTTAPPPPRY
jgi:hypothetical protein